MSNVRVIESSKSKRQPGLDLICILVFSGEFLDILAVSCDSFNEETNRHIGRHQTGKDHLRCLKNARDWCRKYHVAFKVNTVVNKHNFHEDMNHNIRELAPIRWKVSKTNSS